MSNKRKTKAELETELAFEQSEKKKAKSAISAVAKEFVCPISLDLPIEPVTASDGRVYNRADIQRHIDTAKKERKAILSPVTKEKLKEELLPAVQVTNTIRSLIESGAVDGELADQWMKIDDYKKKAEKGDDATMCYLAACYYGGLFGLMKDYEKAYYWYEKAAEGSIHGMAWKGILLLWGLGVKKDPMRGTSLLTMAAERGSASGAYNLGRNYFLGIAGFHKNTEEAKFWFKKAAENTKVPGATTLGTSESEALHHMLGELERES